MPLSLLYHTLDTRKPSVRSALNSFHLFMRGFVFFPEGFSDFLLSQEIFTLWHLATVKGSCNISFQIHVGSIITYTLKASISHFLPSQENANVVPSVHHESQVEMVCIFSLVFSTKQLVLKNNMHICKHIEATCYILHIPSSHYENALLCYGYLVGCVS